MLMKDTIEWATIGKIVAPFGIRGELKVKTFTDIPDRFVMLDAIYLRSQPQKRPTVENGPDSLVATPILYPIEGVRPYKGEMLLLKLRGVDDPTVAETVRDSDLCIPLSALPQLPPDSYYQHDIVGLRVFKLDDTFIGVIDDIMSTGGNDVYILKSPDKKQILIPAIKDVVKQIDLIRHVMYIDPMRGLLDDDAVVDDQTEQEDE
jgi:16S rRNA processing protein RimM